MAGKACLVTGANQGIGKETAIGLARLGGTVVITARDRALVDVKHRSASDAVERSARRLATLTKLIGGAGRWRYQLKSRAQPSAVIGRHRRRWRKFRAIAHSTSTGCPSSELRHLPDLLVVVQSRASASPTMVTSVCYACVPHRTASHRGRRSVSDQAGASKRPPSAFMRSSDPATQRATRSAARCRRPPYSPRFAQTRVDHSPYGHSLTL